MSFRFDSVEDAYEQGRNSEYFGPQDFKLNGGFPMDLPYDQREAFKDGWYETHMDCPDESDWIDGAWDGGSW